MTSDLLLGWPLEYQPDVDADGVYLRASNGALRRVLVLDGQFKGSRTGRALLRALTGRGTCGECCTEPTQCEGPETATLCGVCYRALRDAGSLNEDEWRAVLTLEEAMWLDAEPGNAESARKVDLTGAIKE